MPPRVRLTYLGIGWLVRIDFQDYPTLGVTSDLNQHSPSIRVGKQYLREQCFWMLVPGANLHNMKYVWPCLIVCLFLMPSTVHAQTLSITRLTYPSIVPAGTLEPITVSAAIPYNGSKPGYWLLVGIADLNSTVVSGSADGLPNGCVGEPTGLAFCRSRVQSTSGIENVQFKIGGIFADVQRPPGPWQLQMLTNLNNANNTLVKKSSTPFTINFAPISLTIILPRNVSVWVDGTRYTLGSIPVGLGRHMISVPSFAPLNETARLRFDGWADGVSLQNRTIQVTSSTTLRAIYVTQYLLTIQNSAQVVSVSGAGWYDAGSTATFSVPVERLPTVGFLDLLGAKGTFQGWFENGKPLTSSTLGTVKMAGPHTITAQWNIDYTLPTIILVLALGLCTIAYLTVVHPTRKRKRATRRRAK